MEADVAFLTLVVHRDVEGTKQLPSEWNPRIVLGNCFKVIAGVCE